MLWRRLAAIAVAVLMAPAARAAEAPRGLEFVDLTGRFATVWQDTSALPESERAAVFRADFAEVLPGFYARPPEAAARYDERILRGLKAYPKERSGIEHVSRSFETMFRGAIETFEAKFGPMRGYPPVYLVHSLGEFDGGTRTVGGKTTLMFGADMIARLHAGDDLAPFLHHELFHLRHAGTFHECDQAWCALWAEGMAVYVAATLNPGATDSELLLTQPEAIRPAVESHRAAAVCAALARLDSEEAADLNALFSFQRLSPELPPRFGYYVGYLAVADLAKTHALTQLAPLDNAAVRPLLERSLRGLADCPA